MRTKLDSGGQSTIDSSGVNPHLSPESGGFGSPSTTDEEHAKNNLPDVLARWSQRDGAERERARTEQSFCVPKEILADLAKLEEEIQHGMKELEGMLG